MASRSHYSMHAVSPKSKVDVPRAVRCLGASAWCLHADRAFPFRALAKRSCTRLSTPLGHPTFHHPRSVLHLNFIKIYLRSLSHMLPTTCFGPSIPCLWQRPSVACHYGSSTHLDYALLHSILQRHPHEYSDHWTCIPSLASRRGTSFSCYTAVIDR
jgi:hypothetical protein